MLVARHKIHSKVQRSSIQTEALENEGHRIAVIEVQGALFFGACARLQSQAKALIGKGAEFLNIDLHHMTSIDSTGCALLRTLAVNCGEGGRAIVDQPCRAGTPLETVAAPRASGRSGKATVYQPGTVALDIAQSASERRGRSDWHGLDLR